jgi:hypothetical protein
MKRSRLKAATGMRYAMLNLIIEELAREGRIKMTAGKRGDIISLVCG